MCRPHPKDSPKQVCGYTHKNNVRIPFFTNKVGENGNQHFPSGAKDTPVGLHTQPMVLFEEQLEHQQDPRLPKLICRYNHKTKGSVVTTNLIAKQTKKQHAQAHVQNYDEKHAPVAKPKDILQRVQPNS